MKKLKGKVFMMNARRLSEKKINYLTEKIIMLTREKHKRSRSKRKIQVRKVKGEKGEGD